MNKSEAIQSLGGTVKAAAASIGVSEAAVYMWPDPLPDRIRDRVQAALWRRMQRDLPIPGAPDLGNGGESVHATSLGGAAAPVHQNACGVR